MKKVLAICLMVVMVLGMSAVASADDGGFVSSPSQNAAPAIADYSSTTQGAELNVVPYSERTQLPQDDKDFLEQAYADIKAADDLTQLVPGLAAVAAGLGVQASDLAVSDLFDLFATVNDQPVDGVGFTFTLTSETFKKFAALLHKTESGWVIVDNASVSGTTLTATVDECSPFAIVVNTGSPNTGDNVAIAVFASVMAAAAIAIVLVFRKNLKKA